MRYIVTGGAGFIGSHLVGHLAGEGHEVVIIDDLSAGKMEHIEPLLASDRVTFIQETITDLDFMLEQFNGADGVFHQAAMVSVPRSIMHPISSHEINSTGTLNVLIAARDTGVRKVVFASSAAVYGNLPGLPKQEEMQVDPLSPYALAKLTSEYYCKLFSGLYGLQTVSLRYFNVYGPRQDPHSDYAAVIPRFIHRLKNGEPPIIYGDGEQTRDFVNVHDVVQANIRAMEGRAEGVFNVASGVQTSVNEVARVLIDLLDYKGEPVYVPERPGEVKHSVADVGRAERELGYRVEYGLEEGMRGMV